MVLGSGRYPTLLPLLVTAAMVLAACGDDVGGSGGWGGTVDTLANGAVRVSNPAGAIWGEEDRWHLALDLRLGALESAGPDQFGSVSDVAVDPEGRIYVLERQAREVRVFASDGSHVRTFGSQGGGPGELESPNSLEWGPRGDLWVVDFGNRRYEVFDTAGVRIGSHPFQGLGFGFGNRWGPDGLLYEFVSLRTDQEIRQVVIRRRLEAGPGSVVLPAVDTLNTPELDEGETEAVTMSQGDLGFTVRFPVPLTPRGRRVLVPAGGWWLSDGGMEYRLSRVDFQGDTARVVEREYEPVPVTDEAREEALGNLPEGMEIPPDRIPDVHPPVEGLAQAPGGELWVRRRVAPDRDGYDVFDTDGRYLGEVTSEVPLDRFQIQAFRTDVLYGTLLDELDVPYVVRLRIEKP